MLQDGRMLCLYGHRCHQEVASFKETVREPFNFKEGDGREPAGTFCSLGVVLISHPPMLALSFSDQVRCSFFLIT